MIIVNYKISRENFLYFLVFFLSFLVLIILYVFEYNQLAVLKNKISFLKEELKQNQILKTELTNQYFQITSFENLKEIAKENNLILISKPRYLKID